MPNPVREEDPPATEAVAPSPLVHAGIDTRTIESTDGRAANVDARVVRPASRGNLRALWSMRDFRVFLTGEAISAIGDAVTLTALPLLVLALTGSGVAMGVVGVLQMLHAWANSSLTHYAAPEWRAEGSRQLAEGALRELRSAEPGSQHQLTWARFFAFRRWA